MTSAASSGSALSLDLALDNAPTSVAEARRWVVAACHAIGRDDLAESAELAVSELVTNALLHGEPPLAVRLGGTSQHPRFEVSDGSRTPPVPPEPLGPPEPESPGAPEGPDSPGSSDADGPLASLSTVGRGLRLVALGSEAWGARIGGDGKVVWFVPRADAGLGRVPEPPLVEWEDGSEAPEVAMVDPVRIRLLGLPLPAYRELRRHVGELRRELRLLTLAHEEAYPLAGQLSELFTAFARDLPASLGPEATAAGLTAAPTGRDEIVDAEVVVDRELLPVVARLLDVLDVADDFARGEQLLATPPSARQRAFDRWYLGEFVHQGRGREPLAWSEPPEESPPESPGPAAPGTHT